MAKMLEKKLFGEKKRGAKIKVSEFRGKRLVQHRHMPRVKKKPLASLAQ